MVYYIPLVTPDEQRRQLREIIDNWSRPLSRYVSMGDRETNREFATSPNSYSEYLITTDIAFYVSERYKSDPNELIVPACAILTVYVEPENWNQEKFIPETMKIVNGRQQLQKYVRKRTELEKKRVAYFQYTKDRRDWTLILFDDGMLRLGSVTAARRISSTR